MQITLAQSDTRKRARHSLQARFDKLRRQLERQEQRNRKLAVELDALVEHYQDRLRDIDRRQLDSLIRLAERLITFFTRKSLARWQREELGDWINETLQRIDRIDPAAAEPLAGDFRRALADHLDMSEEEMQAQAEEFTETLEAVFEQMFAGSRTDGEDDEVWHTDGPQADLFEDLGFEFFDDDDDDSGFEDADDAPVNPDSAVRTRRLMDGSWARSLFRRAAQALHPDRESDPGQRQHKQVLMQQLLAARDQADILTLLQLYAEGADSQELALAETEMHEACELMQARLEELEDAQEEIIHEHPLRSLVHEHFYSPVRKTREKRLQAWEAELHSDAQALSQLPGELRNLSILKVFLEQRQAERRYSHLHDLDDPDFWF